MDKGRGRGRGRQRCRSRSKDVVISRFSALTLMWTVSLALSA